MIGDKAPSFDLPSFYNNEISKLSLESIKDDYIVMVFYPHDFTFVCPTEILGYSSAKKDFDGLKSSVLFVSVDSVYVHKAWMKDEASEGGIKGNCYPLLADVTRKMSRDYEMLNEKTYVNYRGTVIIDKNRIVRHYSIYDDRVGRSVEETLRIVRNLKKLEDDKTLSFCPCEYKA